MRKVFLCLFYALCAFTIAFSLFWMALPRLVLSPVPSADSTAETPVPSEPSLAAQALPDTSQPARYLLRDEGGKVAVYTLGPCPADGDLCEPPSRKRCPARQAGHGGDGGSPAPADA